MNKEAPTAKDLHPKEESLENINPEAVDPTFAETVPEDKKEEELSMLYGNLEGAENQYQHLLDDQQSLSSVRQELGLTPDVKGEKSSEMQADLQSMKDSIFEAEQAFLDLPENKEKGEELLREEFVDTAEFKELQKEFARSIKEAQEKFIAETVRNIEQKHREDFRNAINGEKALRLFKTKFAVLFKKALETPDQNTHVMFRLSRYKQDGKDDALYFEGIDIENKVDPALSEKEAKAEVPTSEIKSDASLVGETEKDQIEDLEADGYKKQKAA